MEQTTVLIVSDDAEFSRSVAARWQCERTVPAFTLMSGDLCPGLNSQAFDFAIVGAIDRELMKQLVPVLKLSGKPVVHVRRTSHLIGEENTGMVVLRQEEGWLDTLVLVGSEILRRCEAQARLRRLDQANVLLQRQATLGRYILEMRHTVNNALTSVLGNSELLLLEPGSLTAEPRSQIGTIRNMALRIHEVFQRFSSLDNELRLMEKQLQQDRSVKSASASVGS
ncbi:MAG: hypothetical protein NVS1B11_26710 [Terriglobales bacterium]